MAPTSIQQRAAAVAIMALLSGFSIVADEVGASFEANAVGPLDCPSSPDVMSPLPELEWNAPDQSGATDSPTITIVLRVSGDVDGLCTLSRSAPGSSNAAGGSGSTAYRHPIGRSYGGYDWEAVAGPEVRAAWLCGVVDDDDVSSSARRACRVTLPRPVRGDGVTYHLTSYRRTVDAKDEAARFFERATFGATVSDLRGWTTSALPAAGGEVGKAQASWVYDQIYSVDMSSHREYFRRRANQPADEVYVAARSGPGPCEAGSYWRRYAFNRLDAELKYNITVEKITIPSPVVSPTPAPSVSPSHAPSASSMPSAAAIFGADFDDGANDGFLCRWGGCSGRGGGTNREYAVDDAVTPPRDGTHSLLFANRTGSNYLGTNLKSYGLQDGQRYHVSGWVKMTAVPQAVTIEVRQIASMNKFYPVGGAIVETAGEWVRLEGTFTPDYGGIDPQTFVAYQIYFGTEGSTQDFYVDNVSIRPDYSQEELEGPANSLIPNWNFEGATKNGWKVAFPGSSNLVVDTHQPYSGKASLLHGNVNSDKPGPLTNRAAYFALPGSTLVAGRSYYFSARVRSQKAAARVQMWIQHRRGASGGSDYAFGTPAIIRNVYCDEADTWYEVWGYHTPKINSTDPGDVWLLYLQERTETETDIWIDDVVVLAAEDIPPRDRVDPNTAYVLSFGGHVRTVIREPFVDDVGTEHDMDGTEFTLCGVDEIEGSARDFPDRFMLIALEDGVCRNVRGGNPTVNLDPTFLNHSAALLGLPALDLSSLSLTDDGDFSGDVFALTDGGTNGGNLFVTVDMDDAACSSYPNPYDNDSRYPSPSRLSPDPPVFGRLSDGSYVIHDPRILLKENTMTNPISDGGGAAALQSALRSTHGYEVDADDNIVNDENIVQCANERPDFLNQDFCQLSHEETACYKDIKKGSTFGDLEVAVTMNNDTLASLHGITAKFIYAITGLIFDDSNVPPGGEALIDIPCAAGNPRSRWVPVDLDRASCTSTTTLHADTVSALTAALESSNDENEYLRDIYMWDNGPKCDTADAGAYGMNVFVASEGRCWKNAHPDYLSVYKFNATAHDGGVASFAKFNETGILVFPASMPNHNMSLWENRKDDIGVYVGRFGDKFKVEHLAEKISVSGDNVTVAAIANDLGSLSLKNKINRNRNGGVLVCGSAGEVAPDPKLDDYFEMKLHGYDGHNSDQKRTVWTVLALKADDQFRQRMAWALYQHFNVATSLVVAPINNEPHLFFYDIFVRNAFGNFRDILKEVAFNPKMAEMLTFRGSQSVRTGWDRKRVLLFPDENFSREVMQLYTIGLHELNADGTEKLDRFGGVIQTYDNKDILSFARIWTGFDYGARRGNVEELHSGSGNSDRTESLQISEERHDFFPKTDLYDGWIGDGYPLCEDMPKFAFLKKGARYELLGGSSTPRMHYDDPNWDANESVRRFILSTDSGLYGELCSESDGACTFPSVVTLSTDLVVNGPERNVDTLRVVQVAPGVFYEYIRRPCVHYAFFNNAVRVFSGKKAVNNMCANPKTPVATRTCCRTAKGGNNNPYLAEAHGNSEYLGERVTLDTNKRSCESIPGHNGNNQSVCDDIVWTGYQGFRGIDVESLFFRSASAYPTLSVYHWTNVTCSIKLKVRSDGLAAIVHDPSNVPAGKEVTPFVSVSNTVSYFGIPWSLNPITNEEVYPTVDDNCDYNACEVLDDGSCLCDAVVSEITGIKSVGEITREKVLELRVGAFDPELYDQAADRKVYISQGNVGGVETFTLSSDSGAYTVDTIFKVTNDFGQTVFLKNVVSMVRLGGTSKYDTRNPVHFMNLVLPERRDAYYEVDALLDHLTRHPNTAPFLAKQLIQYFGISNPSPRYVETVVDAFIQGTYTWDDGAGGRFDFGDETYGDLSAVAAAVVLDREATSAVLDSDPSHGHLREPLLKVIGFMRSMNFERTPHDRLFYPKLKDMAIKIGQMVYDSPDQFSFFSADYSPPGQFLESGLLSPESEILTTSYTIGIMNGFFHLVRNGLRHGTSKDRGFGADLWGSEQIAGNYDGSSGYLSYEPSNYTAGENLVSELATLLTSGRLSEENKQTILDGYNAKKNSEDEATALRFAQQLLSATPEFHSSGNSVKMSSKARHPSAKSEPADVPYKAIVYLNLFGGVDSFNILTPDPTSCDIWADYVAARGVAGMEPSELDSIDAETSDQVCDRFGVNKDMSIYKDLYDHGNGIFFANMGHLHKPVGKSNWRAETGTDLFSHFTMRKESHAIDAFREEDGTGVLGRMLDVMQGKNFSTGPIAIGKRSQIMAGDPSTGRGMDIIPTDGPFPLYNRDYLNGNDEEMRPYLESLNSKMTSDSGHFADHWSQTFLDSWNKSDVLSEIFGRTSTQTPFNGGSGASQINTQLKTVARLIKARDDRGVNRDAFFVSVGGFDHHANVRDNLGNLLPSVNEAISNFWNEINALGIANAVTFVQASEFARTLTPNSGLGTDHAWGGNYFAFGGGMDGGKILGQYPGFNESEPTNIGRGRLVPTTSWDSLFNAIAQWYGITDEDDLNYVLPNRNNFGCRLFTDQDLYTGGTNSIAGCDGETIVFQQQLILNEARYLTPEEQKDLCEALLPFVEQAIGESTARCVVINQKVELLPERRRLSGSFVITADLEISSDAAGEGVGSSIAESLTNNAAEIEAGTNFQGVESIAETTQAAVQAADVNVTSDNVAESYGADIFQCNVGTDDTGNAPIAQNSPVHLCLLSNSSGAAISEFNMDFYQNGVLITSPILEGGIENPNGLTVKNAISKDGKKGWKISSHMLVRFFDDPNVNTVDINGTASLTFEVGRRRLSGVRVLKEGFRIGLQYELTLEIPENAADRAASAVGCAVFLAATLLSSFF